MKGKKILILLPLLLLASCTIGGNTGGTSSQGGNQTSNELADNGKVDIIDYVNNKEETGDQFDFAGNYTPPELKVDGIQDEVEWQNATESVTFGALNQTTMEMYRGESALYCFFDVQDKDIQTVGNNNGDDVTKSDSVEVYFDFKNDAALKPQIDDIQINIGAHGKTRIFVGSNGSWGSWNGLLDYEIKLNGTLNDSSDEDTGFQVELMIPYAQIGIDKTSTFGFSVGHVARGIESTDENKDFTWGGITYSGTFIDPQSPAVYLVLQGNKVYTRDTVPQEEISISGRIIDQSGNPVSNANVTIGDESATTNSSGDYTISNIDPNINQEVNISKTGFKTYSTTLTSSELRRAVNRNLEKDFIILDTSKQYKTTITGTTKNPAEGVVGGVQVKVGDSTTTSDNNGLFSLQVVYDYNLELEVSKSNYQTSTRSLPLDSLVENGTSSLGDVALYSPISTFAFAGTKGIVQVDAEVYRDFEGINFIFKTPQKVTNGDHVELFIDAKETNGAGRDNTDYRFDFNGDGGINAYVHNGTDYIGTSAGGITNKSHLAGTTYYIEVFIPYSLLGVTAQDIIGISAGYWSQSSNNGAGDWDGWSFEEAYVAPEVTSQYCRVGLDNSLYKATSNSVVATKIFGVVTDGTNPITTATVNSVAVNSDGSYVIWVTGENQVSLQISANGYNTKTIAIDSSRLNGMAIEQNVTLTTAGATIQGTCNVNSAKVYYRDDPTIFTYVENGTYSLIVPTTSNAYIVFECDGYQTYTKAIGKAALLQSIENGQPYVFNCTMVAN